MTDIQLSALSHNIRLNGKPGKPPLIQADWLKKFLENARLPTPTEQARSIIRFVGDHVRDTGRPLDHLPTHFFAQIGASNPDSAGKLLLELIHRGILTGIEAGHSMNRYAVLEVDLTLDGWGQYEEEKRGRTAGSYGFIALQFGDEVLDPFLQDVLKPATEELGYQLVDMRDVAQPGLIDNLMREKIRDAAFVLVDLTHDNSGAYWEAGYAEGLGKPVLYLCEGQKFKERRTHFDTNHLTTVTWGDGKDNEAFTNELRATLRRALDLFETT